MGSFSSRLRHSLNSHTPGHKKHLPDPLQRQSRRRPHKAPADADGQLRAVFLAHAPQRLRWGVGAALDGEFDEWGRYVGGWRGDGLGIMILALALVLASGGRGRARERGRRRDGEAAGFGDAGDEDVEPLAGEELWNVLVDLVP